jgi:zinc/manganese transport system substrate-binding protein
MSRNLLAALAAGATLMASAIPARAEINVVATTPEIAALVREIGGDRVSVFAVAKPNQDPHFVDAKPSFMVRVNRAQALFFNGLELEMAWLPLLIQGARNPDLVAVDLSEGIAVRDRPAGTVTRAQGDVHPLGNPHYWYDPRNGPVMAASIAATLKRLEPDQAAYFDERSAEFRRTLDTKLAEWSGRLAPLRGMRVIEFHPKWSYFANWAGLVIANDVESKPGIPPSAAHVKALLEQVSAEKIPLLLQDSFNDPKVGEFLAQKTGIRVLSLPTSVGGADGADTWFGYFDTVARMLSAAASR